MVIFIIFNRAPITPADGAWAATATAAAAVTVFFSRASMPPIPVLVSFNIVNRASALSPGTPTVIGSAILGGEATPHSWAPPFGCTIVLPSLGWWW